MEEDLPNPLQNWHVAIVSFCFLVIGPLGMSREMNQKSVHVQCSCRMLVMSPCPNIDWDQ